MDRLANEKIDRYGQKTIGSLRASWDFLWQDGVPGAIDVRRWFSDSDFGNLPKHRQDAINKAIRGGHATVLVLALLFMSGFFEEDDDEKSAVAGKLEQLLSDMFLLGNIKRLHYMAAPPMLQTAKNLGDTTFNFLNNAKYQRKTKYFEKGDPKYMGSGLKLLPRFLREVAFENKD